ncbi:hypothetical protein RGU72_04670 [Undibacterium sp. 5I1]|uniref:hypothetical protein n=1 Tax=unclassified Undibacterium TaxID=2630295 RepID=UPI002AB362C1|nr:MULTISPECIES: hypothetical protein [unclassified Undibacterium]MDY7537545.1 hypothetical protein [Undibacterium sp. 5I1]MEB0231929.1 hypothetical protein [Undibacterium sp. 10I3]MEB0256280.1 hypothetical protein [Undibacterium sp. 5I1]
MKKILLALAIASALSACGSRNDDARQPIQYAQQAQPQYASQAAPVIVQQPQQSSGTGDMLMGAAIGAMGMHLLSGNNNSSQQTQVVERRTVVNNYIERPATPASTSTPTPTPTVKPVVSVVSPKPAAPSYANVYRAPAPKPAAPSYVSVYKPSAPSYSSPYRPSTSSRK